MENETSSGRMPLGSENTANPVKATNADCADGDAHEKVDPHRRVGLDGGGSVEQVMDLFVDDSATDKKHGQGSCDSKKAHQLRSKQQDASAQLSERL